jgi:hypothetical protein
MRTTATTITALVLITGAIAYGAIGHADRGPNAGHPTAVAKEQSGLRLTGHVNGLYPGAASTLRVKIRNPFAFRVTVRRVRAHAGTASAGCGRENLVVGWFRGRRRIPAHRSRRVRLPITMIAAAPDACQGGRFPLRYTARAVR